MRVRFLFLPPGGLGLGLLAATAAAADPAPPEFPAVVTGYVGQAWAANLGLDRERRDLDSARARLEAARGALGPRLDLAARYTVARGGRTIDIPVGDLVNPVYSALNRLTASDQFPTVENQSIAFLRRHEQETKLRLIQPLYHPEIRRGVEASREETAAAGAALAAFQRELRLEVQRAYFRWQQAGSAVEVYTSAAAVVAEAVRVNRVLVAADAATEDAILRLEADAQLVEQQRLAAAADTALAAAHLNLLLNRPAADPIDPLAEAELERLLGGLRQFAAGGPRAAPTGREELVALEHAVQAAEAATRAARAARQPAVSLAVESGLQGESYRTGSGAGFTQASVVAEWNLFDGRRAASRVRVAANEQARAAARRAEVRRQLELQAADARRRFDVALASIAAAAARQAAAERVFALVTGRSREGLVNQLGFLDARHDLTAARLNHATARSQLCIAFAELDRATALSPLP
jgi:outer membrane protein